MPKILLVVFLAGISASAQDSFTGTWRLNTGDAHVNVPEHFLVKDGLFSCAVCDPPVKNFQADGQPHKAAGAPYYDSATVRIVDEYIVEFATTRNGQAVEDTKYTVSHDNQSAVRDDNFISESGQRNHETDIWKRTASGPPGSHRLSGTWLPVKLKAPPTASATLPIKLRRTA